MDIHKNARLTTTRMLHVPAKSGAPWAGLFFVGCGMLATVGTKLVARREVSDLRLALRSNPCNVVLARAKSWT